MLIEIIKDYKKLKVGDKPNVADAYGAKLVKEKIAKEVKAAKNK